MKIEPHVHFVVKFVEPNNYDYDENIKNIDDLKQYNDEKKAGQDIITDSFTFIVADKLTYFDDLQKYLLEDALSASCQDVVLKNFAWFHMKQPIFFTGRYEWNGSFLPDAHVKDRPLVCRPLTEKDIVLNTNLHQIFPKKTGRIPEQLVQLLNKTTEKIY